MKRAVFCDTPMGKIGITEENGAITNVFFGNTVMPQDFVLEQTPLLKRACAQLTEYFSGARTAFDLPLCPVGTAFECACWQALQEIPYGQTRTYKQLATALGKPNACRAVGRANSRNPVSIFIPCHRVIGADGKLTGYAGGLAAKEYLLKLEGAL